MQFALEAAELGFKILPLRMFSKKPAREGWRDEATTDEATIRSWLERRPKANYGIACGPGSNTVVIDLDGPEAQAWWASTGIPTSPAAVTTPSGPDRTHLYYFTDLDDIETNKGKLAPGVDVRAWGGYVVGPGSVIEAGTYVGDLSNIPNMPQALLDILPRRGAVQAAAVARREENARQQDLVAGAVTVVASESEIRQVAKITRTLDALPRVWVEGAGWRSTMYQMGCWLARMVNSDAYAMDQSNAVTILLTHTPTNAEWRDDAILEQWASCVSSTEGQFADAPEETFMVMLDFLETANQLPEHTSTRQLFSDLCMTEPEIQTDGHYSARRQTIVVEALKAGLTEQQAASVAWGSTAGTALRSSASGSRTLWAEVVRAQKTLKAESEHLAVVTPIRPVVNSGADAVVNLLTKAERKFLAGEKGQWFGTRYMDWAATRVKAMNKPYHRMNRWTLLSLIFAPMGQFPLGEGELSFNIFSFVLGGTTTGKSASMKLLKLVLKACYSGDEHPNIGGDASPNSLVEKLIMRDGLASWFNADEAHGLFKEMQGVTWRSGLREKWTMLYENEVPIILRNGKKDLSGIDATTFFVMHLMGTKEGMSEVLDAEFWTSGFLARFVWAIGDEIEQTAESMKLNIRRGAKQGESDTMPKQWAAEFQASKEKLMRAGPGGGAVVLPVLMDMTEEAEERHNEFTLKVTSTIAGHKNESRLKPTSIRFGLNIVKCAGLVALSEGRKVIELRDELIAIEQAEEWLTNIFIMVNATDETALTRDTNRLEHIIATQQGQEIDLTKLHTLSPRERKRDTEELLEQLAARGRISFPTLTDGTKRVRLAPAA